MNEPLSSQVVTFEALMVLENQLVVSTKINRQYDSKFGQDGAKIGDNIRVRKPARFLGRDGWEMQTEDFVEDYVNVTLNKPMGVDTNFETSELLLDIDDFSNRVLKPQISRLATKIDLYVTQTLSTALWSAAGVPGTVPNQMLTYLTGQQLMADNSAPEDDQRYMVINAKMHITIVDALKTLFQAAEQISSQYKTGRMGNDAMGYQWYMSQNIYTLTTGVQGGTPLINGANQAGTALVTDGWTAAALQRLVVGDRFTITGVYHVNPANYQATSDLQQFDVMAPGVTDGSGNMTIQIMPPLVGPGTARQTVDSLPADNAPITVLGPASTRSPQGMCFHRDVGVLVSADLPIPGGVNWSGRAADDQVGISIAMIQDFVMKNRTFPTRTDTLIGVELLRGELGSVICS